MLAAVAKITSLNKNPKVHPITKDEVIAIKVHIFIYLSCAPAHDGMSKASSLGQTCLAATFLILGGRYANRSFHGAILAC